MGRATALAKGQQAGWGFVPEPWRDLGGICPEAVLVRLTGKRVGGGSGGGWGETGDGNGS